MASRNDSGKSDEAKDQDGQERKDEKKNQETAIIAANGDGSLQAALAKDQDGQERKVEMKEETAMASNGDKDRSDSTPKDQSERRREDETETNIDDRSEEQKFEDLLRYLDERGQLTAAVKDILAAIARRLLSDEAKQVLDAIERFENGRPSENARQLFIELLMEIQNGKNMDRSFLNFVIHPPMSVIKMTHRVQSGDDLFDSGILLKSCIKQTIGDLKTLRDLVRLGHVWYDVADGKIRLGRDAMGRQSMTSGSRGESSGETTRNCVGLDDGSSGTVAAAGAPSSSFERMSINDEKPMPPLASRKH